MRARLLGTTLGIVLSTLLLYGAEGSNSLPMQGRPWLSPAELNDRRETVAGELALLPAADNEVEMDVRLHVDPTGDIHVLRKGSFSRGEEVEYVWLVELSTRTYSVLRLTGEPSDAGRIAGFYGRRGMNVPADVIRRRLSKTRERGAANTVAQSSYRAGQPMFNSSLMGYGSSGDVETDDSAEVSCQGFGHAIEEVWEPARWIFNVDEVAHVEVEVDWWRGESEIWPWSWGGCWANPNTFVYTTWFADRCEMYRNTQSYQFDHSVIGDFHNHDFMFDTDTTWAVAQVGIQAINQAGAEPHWYGYTWAWGDWAYWFNMSWGIPSLTGHTFGWAWENCD